MNTGEAAEKFDDLLVSSPRVTDAAESCGWCQPIVYATMATERQTSKEFAVKVVFTRDSIICYSAYMLSNARPSVRHTGGS